MRELCQGPLRESHGVFRRHFTRTFVVLALFCAVAGPRLIQAQGVRRDTNASNAQQTGSMPGAHSSDPRSSGTISGAIIDKDGAALEGVQVQLKRKEPPLSQEALSDDDGKYSFTAIPPGPFQIVIGAEGFAPQTVSGTLASGQSYTVPDTVLTIAMQKMQVVVSAGLTPIEIAQYQLGIQEQQRVFGIVPNFYVTYVSNAKPLTWKQKYALAWKLSSDRFTLVGSAALAGVEQAGDDYNGYGQGLKGYAKRYGQSYGDIAIGTFVGSAVLPSLLRQDPRYFYKGKGSTRSRLVYALAAPFIAKGDNGKWQPNYSYIGGNLGAAEISNVYYPKGDRAELGGVLGGACIRFGESSLSAVLQEFVFSRLTRHRPDSD